MSIETNNLLPNWQKEQNFKQNFKQNTTTKTAAAATTTTKRDH
jgi:hypothetical protein